MKTINNHSAQTAVLSGRAVIVDVREPAEFHENHIPDAFNLLVHHHFIDFRGLPHLL
jgi:rhodanese-related sulfurtransferase